MADPVRRVQIAKDSALGHPVTVGITPAPSYKDAHTVSNQEQETRSTEGHRQSAGGGGPTAHLLEPLPGLLQQAISCSQEDWRFTSGDRPFHSEQASRRTTLRQLSQSEQLIAIGSGQWLCTFRMSIFTFQWVILWGNFSGFMSTKRLTNSHVFRLGLPQLQWNLPSSCARECICWGCKGSVYVSIWTIG